MYYSRFAGLGALAALLFCSTVRAQISAEETGGGDEPSPITPVVEDKGFPHSLAAKVLVVDYGAALPGESSLTNGIDISYLREVNRYVSVAFPIKLGVLNEPENPITKRTFIGADMTAQVGYPFFGDRVTPYATGGFGVVAESMNGTNVQLPIGAGVRIRLTESASLTGQYEFRKSFSADRDNTQIGIGLHFNLGRGKFNPRYWDTDGDSVMDDTDACPETFGLERLKGCPDSDLDGIPDAEDRCPDHPGPIRDKGCPDADSDGVGDPFDECPNVAGTAERKGCPLPDLDGDGFGDDEDACPNIPGKLGGCPDTDADGIVDADDNCPKASGPKSTGGCPDRDNDGVPDGEDNCPLLAGVLNGCPDRDRDGVDDGSDRCPNIAGEVEYEGCPAIMRSQRQLFEYAVKAVRFESGASNLSQEAYTNLTGLADVLERYPDYRLRITGHASPVEVANDRMVLSRRRAEACAVYLESRGVSSSRIFIDGVGAGRPIVREGTSAELGVNSRVEFDLYEAKDE